MSQRYCHTAAPRFELRPPAEPWSDAADANSSAGGADRGDIVVLRRAQELLGAKGPVRLFVSGSQSTLFAARFRHPVLEQNGEVIERLFTVADCHLPLLGRLFDRHVHDL